MTVNQLTGKRSYHSPARAEQAAQTRRRIVAAAAVSFSERGYIGTTMQHIAELAGVSVESVHLVGLKHRLLIMAYRDQLGGGGGEWESVFDSEIESFLDAKDPEAALDTWAGVLAEINPRIYGLWGSLRVAAGTSPEAAAAIDDVIAHLRDNFRTATDWLIELGLVDSSIDRESLVISLYITTSPETYGQLVNDWNFGPEEYRVWVRSAIVQCFRLGALPTV